MSETKKITLLEEENKRLKEENQRMKNFLYNTAGLIDVFIENNFGGNDMENEIDKENPDTKSMHPWLEHLTSDFIKIPSYERCSTIDEMYNRMSLIRDLAMLMELTMDLKYTEKDASCISDKITEQMHYYRDDIKEFIGIYPDEETVPIGFAVNTLPFAYEFARMMYCKCNDESFRSRDSIPVECPWTLQQLIEDDIDQILDKLPLCSQM